MRVAGNGPDVICLGRAAVDLYGQQVGGRLGISEITVKAHRGKVMRKMEAASLADLVIKAAKLGLSAPPEG